MKVGDEPERMAFFDQADLASVLLLRCLIVSFGHTFDQKTPFVRALDGGGGRTGR